MLDLGYLARRSFGNRVETGLSCGRFDQCGYQGLQASYNWSSTEISILKIRKFIIVSLAPSRVTISILYDRTFDVHCLPLSNSYEAVSC